MKNIILDQLREDFGDFVSEEEPKRWALFGFDRAEKYGEFKPPSVPPIEEIEIFEFIKVDENYR